MKNKKIYIKDHLGFKIKGKPFLSLVEVFKNRLKTTTACKFYCSSFWVITQAYFYVILDGNSDYSFNTKLKLKDTMERIVNKIKLEIARKIIYIKELYYCFSLYHFEGTVFSWIKAMATIFYFGTFCAVSIRGRLLFFYINIFIFKLVSSEHSR